jgi:hypothetical protein
MRLSFTTKRRLRSRRMSRIAVARGVFRVGPGAVKLGNSRHNPAHRTSDATAVQGEFLVSHSKAASANRDNGICSSFRRLSGAAAHASGRRVVRYSFSSVARGSVRSGSRRLTAAVRAFSASKHTRILEHHTVVGAPTSPRLALLQGCGPATGSSRAACPARLR